MNSVAIMGRLGQRPELKTTNSGTSVCSFSIAVPRYSKANGEQTDWIRCTAWNGTAEFITKYFNKGQMIALEGRLTVNSWTDEAGKRRSNTEVTVNSASFCGGRNETQAPAGQLAPAIPDIGNDDDADELPF